MPDKEPAPAHPAATVVLVRRGTEACEILLVRRSKKLSFHGGAWVFPGGRIDPQDYDTERPTDVTLAAQRAAVREAREEASVVVDPSDLILLSRWITPEMLPKRFDTYFFVTSAAEQEISVDGGEIREYQWLTPDDALAARGRGEIELPPPTFVTLLRLSGFRGPEDALRELANEETPTFTPRICMVDGGACSLYEGDAGYESNQADRPGSRHRLWLLDSGWRYEKS
jgi:8-oxo-dGTP pyrophosphatase MutT (NUDIX family)